MQHTLVAVFDNRNDAKLAMDALLASSFTNTTVRLSHGDTADASEPLGASASAAPDASSDDGSFTSSIRHFFTDIFGTDDTIHAQQYSRAVTRGHHVLTVGPVSEPEVERAADIVESFGPIDIDEDSDGAAGTEQIMRRDSASLQGSQSVSFQNEDRAPFQQGNLNDAVPMGGTYQEPSGDNGNLGLSGRSDLDDDSDQRRSNSSGMSMQDGTQQGSLQRRDPSSAATSAGAFAPTDIKRPGVRVFARDGGDFGNPAGGRLGSTGLDSLGTNALQQQDQDAAYRDHYNSTYGGQGGLYDDYAPAYSYGSALASQDKYLGRSWDDAEADIRSDWDARNAGTASTWEKVKAAVRHGWYRVTE